MKTRTILKFSVTCVAQSRSHFRIVIQFRGTNKLAFFSRCGGSPFVLISDQLSYWVLEKHLTVDMSFGEDQILSYDLLKGCSGK